MSAPGFGLLGPRTAIANWFVRRRAFAFMVFTLGSGAAGIVLTPLMAQVADAASWRVAWVLMGMLVWAVAPLAWFTVRRRPEDVGLLPDGVARDEPGERLDFVTGEAAWTVADALRTRTFWLLTAGFTLHNMEPPFFTLGDYFDLNANTADVGVTVNYYLAFVADACENDNRAFDTFTSMP